MTTVAWGANWERTETFAALGLAFEELGVRSVFVVTRRQYFDHIVRLGVDPDRILWLHRKDALAFELSPDLLKRIRKCEELSGQRVNDLMLMDRHQFWREPSERFRYFCYVFDQLERFFARHQVSMMLGQPDTTHDLAGCMMLTAYRKSKGLTGTGYAALFGSRARSTIIGHMWDGMLEGDLLSKTPGETAENPVQADEVIRTVMDGGAPRTSFHAKWSPRDLLIARLIRMMNRALFVSQDDGEMYTLSGLFKHLRYPSIPVNKLMMRVFRRQIFTEPDYGKRYVLFALHLAPEHTTDVEAPFHTNVDEFIASLARSLPADVELWVKEHPVALGVRGMKNFRLWKRLPGVRVVPTNTPTQQLIKNALLTVSLSGTVALEAGLQGRPAVIFSDIFLTQFSTVTRLEHPSEVGEFLTQQMPAHDPEKDRQIMQWLIENAVVGSLFDPMTDPTSMTRENITGLAGQMVPRIEDYQKAEYSLDW